MVTYAEAGVNIELGDLASKIFYEAAKETWKNRKGKFGEVAELGARISGYGSFNYNWGAGVAWFAKKERLIGGKKIKPGDKVVALYEEGFRSNGFSLVRKIMKNNFSENWTDKCFDGKSVGERALTPSRIYTRAIVDMTGGFDGEEKVKINGMAHITGGGIPGKLGRLLKPSGFGADLENLFSPSEFVKFVQQQGKVPDKEAYKTWNMGNGMLIVTREPKKVIEIAKLYGIESREVGVITENSIIKIISKGFYSEKNQSLNFDL